MLVVSAAHAGIATAVLSIPISLVGVWLLAVPGFVSVSVFASISVFYC